MAGRGWVYDTPFWHADMGVTYDEWVQGVRELGWKLWLPGQTWEPVACEVNGRMTYGVSVRRWDGPGPEPPPLPGGPEDP